jgi:arginine metabolism regulation protein II
MSEWLVSSAPPKTNLRILSQIDDECERARSQDEIEICQGPFGAFRLNPVQNDYLANHPIKISKI